jgi:3-dehydroquinate dehydratase / shikimate dehydrogenase
LARTAEKTRIVGSFAPASMAEARGVAPFAGELDFVEVRLDAFREPADLPGLRDLFAGRTLLATLRTKSEGGAFAGSAADARAILSAALAAGFDLVDVEFRSGENASLAGFPKERVVVSAHDFEGLPPDVPGLAARMAATGARFVKVVGTANDSSDAVRLLEDQASLADSNVALFAMGEAGMATRVLGPYVGSPLMFGSFVPGGATAPGQIAAGALAAVYGVGRSRRVSRLVALFGSRVSHSLSPALHNARFEALGEETLYVPFALRFLGEELAPLRAALGRLGLPLAAASVTIPFKEEAGALSGAPGPANTLVFGGGGAIRGANTDAAALESLIPAAKGGERALVLGAGGTARTAVEVLRKKGYEVVVVARRPEQAEALAASTGARALAAGDPASLAPSVLVNATPIGLDPGDPLPCDAALLRPGLFVLDAPYREGGTELVCAARATGCEVVDGFAFLLSQAAGQAELFSGRATTADDLVASLPAHVRGRFAAAPREVSR